MEALRIVANDTHSKYGTSSMAAVVCIFLNRMIVMMIRIHSDTIMNKATSILFRLKNIGVHTRLYII